MSRALRDVATHAWSQCSKQTFPTVYPYKRETIYSFLGYSFNLRVAIAISQSLASGNISRMPGDELVMLRTKARGNVPIRAYLAESHSWGGHSGSPVFWHFTYNISAPGPGGHSRMVARGFIMALLGLVSGHFDIPISVKRKARPQSKDLIERNKMLGWLYSLPQKILRSC